MYVFKVNGDSYKIRFGYGVLYKTDLIDRVIKATSGQTDEGESPADVIKNLLGLTAELLLEGLQKHHKDKFGYDTDEEREQRILEVCDLIDDFEDEHADDESDDKIDGSTLFVDLQKELERNGFLSRISQGSQEALAEENATVVPMDRQKKTRKKVGEKA